MQGVVAARHDGQHSGRGGAGFKVVGAAQVYSVGKKKECVCAREVPGFWPGGWLGGDSICKLGLVLGPEVSADEASLIVFQVNEIYHDESLGAHINVVLVRIILLSPGKVSERSPGSEGHPAGTSLL